MYDLSLFYNKFDIPLTITKTEEVFDNINSTGIPQFIDSRFIKSVYLPVHAEDGTSGRPFLYNYNKEDYYNLIKKILAYKPVIVTFPQGIPNIMEKYINLGVKNFMVSKWNGDYSDLKIKYPDLKIYRSIVLNSYNDNIDERFDGIVIPYKRILDIEWLEKSSKQTELIAIINHYCRPNCNNLDNHLEKELSNYTNEVIKPYSCPKERNAFIPRQIVLKINKYISSFKLVDRMQTCFYYEQYIKYYLYGDLPHTADNITQMGILKTFYENAIVHKLYEHSNLVNINCKFECQSCDKKCY